MRASNSIREDHLLRTEKLYKVLFRVMQNEPDCQHSEAIKESFFSLFKLMFGLGSLRECLG